MASLRVEGLPQGALAAAAAFHAEWLGRAQALLAPPATGADLVLIFPPADHTHHAWQRAAVQSLAREHAPRRINAISSDDCAAIAAAEVYLASAPGLTGQLLRLDGAGDGVVLGLPR